MSSVGFLGSPSRTRPPQLGGPLPLRLIRDLRDDPLEFLSAVAREAGDICALRIGPTPVVVLSSPELIRQVLVADADQCPKGRVLLRALRPLLGNGLLTSSGELHARQRQLIAPHFFARNLDRYVDVVASFGEEICREWAPGERIELVSEMQRLTTKLVGRMMLSIDIDEDPRLVEAMTEAFAWEMHALTHPLALPLRVPTPRNRRMQRALGYLRERIGGIIAARISSGVDGDDMLAMLLSHRDEEGRRLPWQQVYDEILTLCGAALESTADAMAWTLYLLAKNPEAGAKVRSEADSALRGRAVSTGDLDDLPYALQSFKESMRMYPPAAVIVRAAESDLSLGGYEVRSGTTLILACWVLHRRPDLFPEPESYVPERFDPAGERKIPKGGYLPFGIGPRVCIGGQLALLEGQILTATIGQRVKLELEPDQEVVPRLQMNVRARDGIAARVRHR